VAILRERSKLALVAILLVMGAVLTWPIVSADANEDMFWRYISARSSGSGFSRHDALRFSDVLCSEKPISNIDVRNWRLYARGFTEGAADLAEEKRALALAVPVVTDATFRYICPATKRFPLHPRRDLLAGFPLPRHTVLDSDPVFGRRDDDSGLGGASDDNYRSADYLVPDHLTLSDLAHFYDAHVQSGSPWRGWTWCTATTEGFDGRGGTYIWQRDGQRLFLSWYAVEDDLVHARGTLLIKISAYNAAKSRALPDCV
jgi:hypothetical protein